MRLTAVDSAVRLRSLPRTFAASSSKVMTHGSYTTMSEQNVGTSSMTPLMGSARRPSAASLILVLVSAEMDEANSRLIAESPAMVMVNAAMPALPR